MLSGLVAEAEQEKIFAPQAAYGYFRAAGEGNAIVLFDESCSREIARFELPRQAKDGGLCIADFLRDVDEPERDVLGLQVVTVGQRASEVARDWFAADRCRTTSACMGSASSWPRPWPNMSTARSAPSSASVTMMPAICASCSSRATAARATASATPPARTSRAARSPGSPGRRSHRSRAVRRGPAVARAEHQRHRPPPPPSALFQRLTPVGLPAWARRGREPVPGGGRAGRRGSWRTIPTRPQSPPTRRRRPPISARGYAISISAATAGPRASSLPCSLSTL